VGAKAQFSKPKRAQASGTARATNGFETEAAAERKGCVRRARGINTLAEQTSAMRWNKSARVE
jgi:hypothetical protein